MDDLEILKLIEEKLGISPLKELKPNEILTPAKLKKNFESFPLLTYVFQRGYCLDQQGYIIGLNISFSNLNPAISLISELKHITLLNIENSFNDSPTFLFSLPSLKEVNFRFLFSTDWQFLKELKNLTSLDLSCNKILGISILEQLKNLTSLDLSYNKITDISILRQLKNLSSLNLRDNKISDISILGQLKNLTSLDLSYNKISDITILGQMKNLASLDLSSNNITDISILRELKNLTLLDLSSNNISDISILRELKTLTSLDLSSNNISNISILRELKTLTSLDLSSNNISNISILGQLKNLTSLNLRDNSISDISILGQLKNLTSLNLRNNNISNISILKELENLLSLDLEKTYITDISTLGQLENLLSLNLKDNHISDIFTLGQLKKLTALDLRNNNITDISILGELKNLTLLDLSYNNISDISILRQPKNLSSLKLSSNNISDISKLGQLQSLSSLKLSSNNISDISKLGQLKNLSTLDLSSNNITEISILGQLKNLTSLDLSCNSIFDISMLGQLKNLSFLDLSDNKIKYLFPLKDFKNLQNFWINNNPLQELPKDITEQGIKTIQNYLRQLEAQGKDYCYEAKVMIVGEPGSGKSSLMKKLFNKHYVIPDTSLIATTGIEVKSHWTFPFNKEREFAASIWDFGGQQIQYMLHQFFLTESCLYILMAEKRKELANFDYWLNILHILGKESPVIILFNEINLESVSDFVFDEKKYKELFPEIIWTRLDINLSNISDNRLDVLINTIQDRLKHLDHIGKAVPVKWENIREKLEKRRSEKCMSLENFFEICTSEDITEEKDQLLILKYFHLLGVVLHFNKDPQLRASLFLDPNWTVYAIYTLLSDKDIEKYKGIVPFDFMKSLWDKKGVSIIEQTMLLNLMLKDAFELCYKHPGKPDHYIIPLLLPKKEPDYDWDDTNSLCFRFQYPFMPKGITSRLMVCLNEYIEKNIVWQEGVLFTRDHTRARVVEKQTTREGLKIIEIKLKGTPDKRKELLTIIRKEIIKIQKISFPQLPYYEMVPCTCTECVNVKEKRFYAYSDLQNLLNKGKHAIICPGSGEILDIRQLYDVIIDEQIFKHRPQQNLKKEYFDVFLCHNSKDKSGIKAIGKKLENFGIIPWLDEWNLRPGDSWIKELENQINSIKAVLVFIGPDGVGPWQDQEIQGFLIKLTKQKCRIIPVILRDCIKEPKIPVLLEPIVRVDFRKSEPDPFKRLLFGITGKYPKD